MSKVRGCDLSVPTQTQFLQFLFLAARYMAVALVSLAMFGTIIVLLV